MKTVLVSDSPSTFLSAFTESVNLGIDTTCIRDKFRSMKIHCQKFYSALILFGKINKQIDIEVFATYALSEVDGYAWPEEYDIVYLMKNAKNRTVIAECKAHLSALINSDWVAYIVGFFEVAQPWIPEFFTTSTHAVDKHIRILTPIVRTPDERIRTASSVFTKPDAQRLFTRNSAFKANVRSDLDRELTNIGKTDWRDILLPMKFGVIVEGAANSNYISVSNLIMHANNVINDIYTPDINCDTIRDFVEQGISKLVEGHGRRFNLAKNLISRKTELFRENFHIYYRNYVNDGSMMSFMMGYLEDINSSMEAEGKTDDILNNIDNLQKMIFNKVQNNPAFSSYRPVISKLMEKNERDSLIRGTKESLAKIRSQAPPE